MRSHSIGAGAVALTLRTGAQRRSVRRDTAGHATGRAARAPTLTSRFAGGSTWTKTRRLASGPPRRPAFLHDTDAARRIARIDTARGPGGALAFARLLLLADREEGAQFWFLFAAGGGQATGAICAICLRSATPGGVVTDADRDPHHRRPGSRRTDCRRREGPPSPTPGRRPPRPRTVPPGWLAAVGTKVLRSGRVPPDTVPEGAGQMMLGAGGVQRCVRGTVPTMPYSFLSCSGMA